MEGSTAQDEQVSTEEKVTRNIFKRVYHSLHKQKSLTIVNESTYVEVSDKANQEKIRHQRKSTVPRRSGILFIMFCECCSEILLAAVGLPLPITMHAFIIICFSPLVDHI